MDLKVTGKFISEQRKVKGFTQAKLAEKLNVSEKTISKWECGNGFPDTTLILPLCEVLEISANELLSAKILSTEKEYRENAEQNLIELKSQQEKNTKNLLSLELVIGYLSSITFLVLIFVASFFKISVIWRIALIIIGLLNFFVGIMYCIGIERSAGFYECEHCNHKYVPTYKSVLFSAHMGRIRYMKCPKCGKKSWQKKVISKD